MPSYIRESRIEYGPDWKTNPLYHVRVLGNFPHQSAMCVVGAGTVASGVAAYELTEFTIHDSLHIGVDVAHFGDDETVSTMRRGKKILQIKAVNGFDERRTAYMIVCQVRDNWKLGEPPAQNKVETAGGYGTEVVSRLRDASDKCWTHDLEMVGGEHVFTEREDEQPWGVRPPPGMVHEVNVSMRSTVISPNTGLPEYFNMRSQIWFGIDEWLKDGGALPDDKRLQTELVTPKYELPKNQRKVEPKKEIKKRLGRSPDRGDSLALCIYEPLSLDVDMPVEATLLSDRGWEGRGYG